MRNSKQLIEWIKYLFYASTNIILFVISLIHCYSKNKIQVFVMNL